MDRNQSPANVFMSDYEFCFRAKLSKPVAQRFLSFVEDRDIGSMQDGLRIGSVEDWMDAALQSANLYR